MKKNYIPLFLLLLSINFLIYGQVQSVWEIGVSDNSGHGMALYPGAYKEFVKMDFGFEDKIFFDRTS